MLCPFSRPSGFDGVLQSNVGSLRSTRSISTALKKATDCEKKKVNYIYMYKHVYVCDKDLQINLGQILHVELVSKHGSCEKVGEL